MFFDPREVGMKPEPFKHSVYSALVVPRPIGWISTRGADGSDNLAPYSFFNAVAYVPPQVLFSSTSVKEDRGDTKDSVANIRETSVFAVNIVEYAMKDAMNRTSGMWGRDVDEFVDAGIEKAACRIIECAAVAGAPAVLECRMTQIIKIEGEANFAVFGEVVGVHLRDDCMVDGAFDVTTFQPLARGGYRDYSVVRDVFRLDRPE